MSVEGGTCQNTKETKQGRYSPSKNHKGRDNPNKIREPKEAGQARGTYILESIKGGTH
jgi:hypothetical protein